MQCVTLIKGDGIGPEISEAVIKIFEATKARGYMLLPAKETICMTMLA